MTVSTIGFSTTRPEPAAATLSRTEVAEAVRLLTAGDKTALTKGRAALREEDAL